MMMRRYFSPFFVVFSEFYEQKIQHILYVHRNSMTQQISYKDPNSTSLVRTWEQYDIKIVLRSTFKNFECTQEHVEMIFTRFKISKIDHILQGRVKGTPAIS